MIRPNSRPGPADEPLAGHAQAGDTMRLTPDRLGRLVLALERENAGLAWQVDRLERENEAARAHEAKLREQIRRMSRRKKH